jgi:hypothetical protein
VKVISYESPQFPVFFKSFTLVLFYVERQKYEVLSKTFQTGRLERELQMVQPSATRCSCIAILWVSLVSSASITLCVASQRVFIVAIYFFIDWVRKLLDTPSYAKNSSWMHMTWTLTTREGSLALMTGYSLVSYCQFYLHVVHPASITSVVNSAPLPFKNPSHCIIITTTGMDRMTITYEGVSKSIRTESITKYTLTTINTRWEATEMFMAAKLTRLTHKVVI